MTDFPDALIRPACERIAPSVGFPATALEIAVRSLIQRRDGVEAELVLECLYPACEIAKARGSDDIVGPLGQLVTAAEAVG